MMAPTLIDDKNQPENNHMHVTIRSCTKWSTTKFTFHPLTLEHNNNEQTFTNKTSHHTISKDHIYDINTCSFLQPKANSLTPTNNDSAQLSPLYRNHI